MRMVGRSYPYAPPLENVMKAYSDVPPDEHHELNGEDIYFFLNETPDHTLTGLFKTSVSSNGRLQRRRDAHCQSALSHSTQSR